MITTKPMIVEDFIYIMTCNSRIYPEYSELSESDKKLVAEINIATGTAESYFDDGNLIGVGGIKYVGIGEGWFITTPEFRNNKKKSLLETAKEVFNKTIKEKNLWRVYSSSRISRNFLRHLGFRDEKDNYLVWMRQ